MVRVKCPTDRPRKGFIERKKGEKNEEIIGYRFMYKGFLRQDRSL